MTRLGDDEETKSALGAYGLRISGIPDATDFLQPAAVEWPAVEVTVEVGELRAEAEHLASNDARIRLRSGGWIELRRDPGRARYIVPAPLSGNELIHPLFAPAAAVFTHWHERQGLHGGGFALRDGAWGVIGDRLGGKSSLLAALAVNGVDIVSDDVLVLDGDEMFPGPRTVDLREDAAVALGVGQEIGVAGSRERWRLPLAHVARPLHLRGWIFTRWADELELHRLPASETLRELFRNRSITVPPRDPEALLQLSTFPAWELRRPRSWAAVPETIEALLMTLSAS